jgi:hypothetical protein
VARSGSVQRRDVRNLDVARRRVWKLGTDQDTQLAQGKRAMTLEEPRVSQGLLRLIFEEAVVPGIAYRRRMAGRCGAGWAAVSANRAVRGDSTRLPPD